MKVISTVIPEGKRNHEKSMIVMEWLKKSGIEEAVSTNEAELIISAGGDGTLLHAISNFWQDQIPFFGINCGSKGFLLNPIESYEEFLYGIHNNSSMKFRLLTVEFTRNDGSIVEHKAFNDAYVKADHGKIVSGTVRGEKKYFVKDFGGDGIIIATPHGSTAYSRKAGGQVIPLGHDLLAITPISDYPNTGMIEKLQRIEVEIKERYAIGFADHVRVNDIKKMVVRPSEKFVTLLFKKGYDFEAERFRKSI